MVFEWCVMITPEVSGKPKGAVLADAKWSKGTRISVGFLDGHPELQKRVFSAAMQWIDRTSIDLMFDLVNDVSRADIRISFKGSGSWSLLGRYAKLAPPNTATMNFGWLTQTSTEEAIQEVVLHEFGHAMGFIHEHQNPEGGMKWNRQVVIDQLSGPPNNWNLEEIERNVLGSYDPRKLIGTPFDTDSIMLYPFPASWTTNGVSTNNNSVLSPMDIQLAKDIYG